MLGEFSITQRGESHIKHDKPCQDCSTSFCVPETGDARFVVAVVSDGVGSEDYSDKGAQAAVDAIAQFLSERLAVIQDSQDIRGLIEDAFEYALDAVLDLSDQMGKHFSQFASTLTAAVFDGDNLWYGHAGDDGIVVMYRDGTYEMVTTRHKGSLANSVIPLGAHKWQFGEVSGVASCVLMTDGVLDFCVRPKLENNRVRLPFLKPLVYEILDSEERIQECEQDWSDFLSQSPEQAEAIAQEQGEQAFCFRNVVRDDLSIALLTDSKGVSELPEYSFDLDQWNADSQRFALDREEGLEKADLERRQQDPEYRARLELGRDSVARPCKREQSASAQASTTYPDDDYANSSCGCDTHSTPVAPDGFKPRSSESDGRYRDQSAPPRESDYAYTTKRFIDKAKRVVWKGIDTIGTVVVDAFQELFQDEDSDSEGFPRRGAE